MKTIYTPNQNGGNIADKIGFVIHGTLGSYSGAINWLCTPPYKRNPISYSSAHYVISKTGETTKLAEEDAITWHAGIVRNPTYRARLYLPRNSFIPKPLPINNSSYKNPNNYFVGIECEWFEGERLTEAQIRAVVSIIKSSRIKNPIILSHSEITDYKADFGRSEAGMWNVQEIIRRSK
jgi:N-acetyl-anhydromuramyl-L-alanine amidase AmpD